MAEQKFKLPGSSYDELQKIIIAYSHINGKASNTDISKRAALHPTIVSRNSGFLVECGIVDPGQKKQITGVGSQLANALEHKIDEEAQRTWLQIFEDVPFFETVLSAVLIRGGMDQNTLKSHIAYTAGQKKSQIVMTGAQTVIDILRAAGCLAEDDGRLVVTGSRPAIETSGSVVMPVPVASGQAKVISPSITAFSSAPVTVQIQIQVTPTDIEGLGKKLRKELDALLDSSDSEGG